ncbi:hypothetical protein M422DRAFT_262396 [Sphaerobolus stellatus SS14]|uniref:Class II aldolase/adducin N-terminal domain-containing protein n=1 Tax=Sphaerobolus stellatus (strain SS14) TaxID=990650 RepID=A0A0C9VD27_SPHS4|nr:hypothetical protein M422DRAFT_262396 [Sphaerobolus stellatus SS14]
MFSSRHRSTWLAVLSSAFTFSRAATIVSPSVLSATIDLLDTGRIVDAFGHVSVRNPDNASEFFLHNRSASLAPALATSQAIITYKINNATALALTFNSSVTGPNIPSGSPIYKAFPDVQGVVHSHTTDVLPFAAANVPLKAQMHMGGSIGTLGTLIFDAGKLPMNILPENQPHDLLIRTAVLGDALAHSFPSDSAIVLMKGHGMAVKGASFQAAMLGGSTGLTAREAQDGTNTMESASLLGRAWQLWVAQVDNAGLYVNDLRPSTAP